MNYCGVEFTAVASAEGASWNWELSILDKNQMKTSGEAANREAAINQAHEAIGQGLRANDPVAEATLPEQTGSEGHCHRRSLGRSHRDVTQLRQ